MYTPAIVATMDEDTMSTVFQNYSITWSQPWRIIVYNVILIPIATIAIAIFGGFWIAGYKFVNLVFGSDGLMGNKIDNIIGWATDFSNPKCS